MRIVWFFCLVLTVGAWADQMTVNGKPYSGKFERVGGTVWVDAVPMLEYLGLKDYVITPTRLEIENRSLPVKKGMVPLHLLGRTSLSLTYSFSGSVIEVVTATFRHEQVAARTGPSHLVKYDFKTLSKGGAAGSQIHLLAW